MESRDRVQRAKSVSIASYLEGRGIAPDKETPKINLYSSPFASDSTPSFALYNRENRFHCFSSGKYGDIITLVMLMDGVDFKTALDSLIQDEYKPFVKPLRPERIARNRFNLKDHTTEDLTLVKKIKEYADSRCIHDGYVYSFINKEVEGEWIKIPAIGFVHVDKDLKPCGIKKRSTYGTGDDRFRAKGKQRYYILENSIENAMNDTILYIVESESSANSLWQHAKDNRVDCVVISFGSVSTVPNTLPEKYSKIKDVRIIIDYDGSEKLYNERKEMYNSYDAKFLKIKLAKGEDLNSMYIKKKINLIKLW